MDMDGSFLGAKWTAISHAPGVGENLPFCTKYPTWNNGYLCESNQLAILEFESIAPDK